MWMMKWTTRGRNLRSARARASFPGSPSCCARPPPPPGSPERQFAGEPRCREIVADPWCSVLMSAGKVLSKARASTTKTPKSFFTSKARPAFGSNHIRLRGGAGKGEGGPTRIVQRYTERAPTRGRPSAGCWGRSWQTRRLNSLNGSRAIVPSLMCPPRGRGS